MSSFLLITNADMSLQSGNVVLINRRAEEIYKQFKVKTVCMIIKKNYDKTIPHRVQGLEYISSSSKKEIKTYIINNRPTKIIFYGTSTFRYIPFVKRILNSINDSAEILIDVQGAQEEGIEYRENSIKGVNRYLKYLIKKRMFSYAVNTSEGAFVVSDEMEEYCKSHLNRVNKENFITYKIRCGLNDVISENQKLEWRKRIRKQWGINEKTIVMVFSGYRKPWQKIDLIIENFKRYDNQFDNFFFAFFCNVDDKFKEEIKRSFPKGNYVLKFLSFEDYFKYLSACDVGFILRDYNITNKVAFPNKFSDYLNAGLLVAINSALPEPYRVLKNSGLYFIDVEKDNLEECLGKILQRQNDICEYYKNSQRLCYEELMYSTQILKLKELL